MTSIEWTDETWNPVRGCALVSAGCANCYAMKQAHRFSGEGMPYEGLTELGPQGPRWTGKIRLVPEVLDAPLRWKKPRRIFVNSMSDLFHEDVPDEFILKIFAVMLLTPWHTYQVLTKRPDTMRSFLTTPHYRIALTAMAMNVCEGIEGTSLTLRNIDDGHDGGFILPNVWLGVSVEDQQTADERIPILLQTSAGVRFVSAEPLLGPVQLGCGGELFDYGVGRNQDNEPRIHWVIVGGESGPGARPCDVAWIRSIVEQCKAAAVPCFVKQLGSKPTYLDPDHSIESDGWPDHVRWDTRRVCIQLRDKKGGDPAEWPADLRVREYPR